MKAGRDLRKTGIEIIGDVPWGTHFCQFYKTRQDLVDILVPYFKTGLENNELCIWVTSEPLQVREAEAAMRQAMPDFDDYRRRGAIEILSHTEWYRKGGYFDRDRVLNGWVEKHDHGLARGYDGLRLSGNTLWLEKSLWADFTEYEAAINGVVEKYAMLVLCTYSEDRCGASEVIDVLQNHQFALIKREDQWVLIENSERKRAAEAIERLNEELERRAEQLESVNRDLESFAYSVSHDLRVPLRAIDGFSALLLEDYGNRLDDEGRRLLTVVRESVDKMQRLISDILMFSRSGRVEPSHREIDMEALTWAVYEDLMPMRAGRTVKFEVGMLPHACGDEALIRQVMMNLLSNALKFTGLRNEAHIEVTGGVRDGETVYSVRDNGIGFDMRQASEIFGVFRRLRQGDGFEGTGIGLATVKRIIERHDGRVWAEGKVGEGATFHFALPRPETGKGAIDREEVQAAQ
ncbi:MAG: MEDS domain-containing protein [Gammaproteobacteria bacterium]